jgi:hypothetical protein
MDPEPGFDLHPVARSIAPIHQAGLLSDLVLAPDHVANVEKPDHLRSKTKINGLIRFILLFRPRRPSPRARVLLLGNICRAANAAVKSQRAPPSLRGFRLAGRLVPEA